MQPYTPDNDPSKESPPSQAPGNAPRKTADSATKPPTVTAEVKPRLTKEQHDILEAHFQRQNKPSTNTKKGFAERLGVPLDKINNWFQNRRAKVKQDLKKQMNQYNMLQATLPPAMASHPNLHMQQQPFMPQTCAPDIYSSAIQPAFSSDAFSVQHPASILAPQMPAPNDYNDMLSSIPETTRPGSYSSLMQAFIGAGYSVPIPDSSVAMASQDPLMNFDQLAFANTVSGDSIPQFSAHGLTEPVAPGEHWKPLIDGPMNDPSLQPFLSPTTGPGETQGIPATLAASQAIVPQPISTNTAPIASQYSGWPDEKPATTTVSPNFPREDHNDLSAGVSNAEDATVPSRNGSAIWSSAQQNVSCSSFSSHQLYQQSNQASQTMLSEHSGVSSHHLSAPDFDQPSLPDDAFCRRNSSTSALAEEMNGIGIQSRSSSDAGFVKPDIPPASGLAARRQKRPAALNSTAIRSASYSNGMPSPNNPNMANGDLHLRRIRSTGIPGRVQKPGTGSAQRSPMNLTFGDALDSPKFARHASGFTNGVTCQGVPVTTGSLAPPTPLTPNELARFPPWQSSSVLKSRMQDRSSPDGIGISYPIDPSTAGLPLNTASPPSTPMDPSQLMQSQPARLVQPLVYRDAPPQSAPAAQQSFSQNALILPPSSMAEMQTSHEYPATGKASQFRRPSLPDTSNPIGCDSHPLIQVPTAIANADFQLGFPAQHRQPTMDDVAKQCAQFPQGYNSMNSGTLHPNHSVPDLHVHEYSPPQATITQSLSPPRVSDSRPRNYIWANQGPHDFQQS